MKATEILLAMVMPVLLLTGTGWVANGLATLRQLIGGGPVLAGGFALQGSISKPATGRVQRDSHLLSAGFWGSSMLLRVYLPLVARNAP